MGSRGIIARPNPIHLSFYPLNKHKQPTTTINMKVSAIAYAGLLAFGQVARAQNNDDNDVGDTIDEIGDDIQDIGDNISDGFKDTFDNLKDDVDNLVDDAKSAGGENWSDFIATATQAFDDAKQSYSDLIATASGDAREQATEAFGSLTGAFDQAIASASSWADENSDSDDAGVMQTVSLGLLGLGAGAALFVNL